MTDIPQPQHIMSVDMSGPLTFKGYDLSAVKAKSGDVIELNTYWEIETLAPRPLSLMAHLTGPDGKVIHVADGLGFPIEYWQVNDMIVQRHIFPIPDNTPSDTYRFLVGGYWLDTLDRWSITGAEDNTIVTGEIQIHP